METLEIQQNARRLFSVRKVSVRTSRQLVIYRSAQLPILGVTFQQNCKYSSHVRAKVIKANKSLFVLGSLRKEGMSQEEVDHLFHAIVLPNFSYAPSVYGASDSDLSVIQNFLDRCMKRKLYMYTSKNVNIRDLLEKADKTLYKKRSNVRSSSFYLRKRKRCTILEIRSLCP